MSTPAKIITDNLPTVALVGRVNVGKSTLFNRLIEENKALVSTIPGTTRTRNEGLILWRGKYVLLLDTGGLTFSEEVPLEKDIIKQTEKAIREADVIVFVADAKDGILPQEKELAKIIRRNQPKPILLLANKADNKNLEYNLHQSEWLKLGLGEPFPLSAANGRNTGDFLDLLFKTLDKIKRQPKRKISGDAKVVNVSIIGKPNVGKSSLFNKLIGLDKVIVNSMPHTTREPHDTLVSYLYQAGNKKQEQKINFVDTAGIRRKAQVAGRLERLGIQKSLDSVDQSEIILFVLDGKEIISSQDRQLAGLLKKHSKNVIILINKWDLATDNSDYFRNEVKKMIYGEFPHLNFAPIMLVSGLTGYRVHDIFPEIIHAVKARRIVIPEDALRQFIKRTVREHLPSRGKGVRHPEILGFKQLDTNPPVFELYIKPKTSLHESYVHFVERRLREQFDFFATPIIIRLTKLKR